MEKLSEIEQKQYARQINLSEIGVSGQEKLKNASVLVVGAGGLGCPVLQYLVTAGVGKIGIADGDTIDISNLPRQNLYAFDDIGKPKSITAKTRLEIINPTIIIVAIDENVTNKNTQNLVNQYDIIVDCTDNFDTRYILNDYCQIEKKPLVYASIYKFEGQITVFDFNNNHTLRTLFPQKPENETIPTCDILGILNTHSGIIGLFQANEVLKLILGIGNQLIGKVLILNTLSLESNMFSYTSTKSKTNQVKYIEAQEFHELLFSNPDIKLIDVREKVEFLDNNFGGINIPYSEYLSHKIDFLTQNPIYFICNTGAKSKIMAEKFAKMYPNLNFYTVVGGIKAII